MSYLIRNAHFLVIHVPIAMLIFSFVFDLLALILKKKDWHTAALLCLVVGTLGAIAAVATGPEGERNPLFPQHELFGKVTMVLAIALTVVRLGILWRRKMDIGKNLVYLLVMLVGVGLISYTGHLGGEMVHPDRSQMHRGPGQQQRGFDGGNTNQPNDRAGASSENSSH